MYENVNKERKFTDRSKVQKDLTNIRKKMREVENDMKKLKEKKKFIESELRRLRKEIPGRNKNYANRIAALKKSNYIKPSASKLLKKELGMNKNNKK